jgi:hypothetical protein
MSKTRMSLAAAPIVAAAAALVGLAAANSGGASKDRPAGKSPVIKGRPILSPGATARYWTRERMKHARPAPMGVPGGGSKPPASTGGNQSSGGTASGSRPPGR